ncbi:MAG: zf-TFIIB domain-containing protein [Candidatus Delongbacteria bacterium]|nr:zf-TFIIB domain-containing protein [Candidatus Delongbacteria bacterium]
MICPLCKKPMIILEDDNIEIDYCTSCEGIWLDANELELLFADETAYNKVIAAGEVLEKSSERKRRCPGCRKKMIKIQVGGEQQITYDACPQGEGIWLDKGELDGILKFGLPEREGMEIQRFLGTMFQSPDSKVSDESPERSDP